MAKLSSLSLINVASPVRARLCLQPHLIMLIYSPFFINLISKQRNILQLFYLSQFLMPIDIPPINERARPLY